MGYLSDSLASCLIHDGHVRVLVSQESAVASPCKSSVENVPLRAKPAINFQDAVFYYPADLSDSDDDDGDDRTHPGGRRALAHVLSDGRVPSTAAAKTCCSSDDQLILKEAVSMQPALGDEVPLLTASRRRPSILRRMKAFFGRSSSSYIGHRHDEVGKTVRLSHHVLHHHHPPHHRTTISDTAPTHWNCLHTPHT